METTDINVLVSSLYKNHFSDIIELMNFEGNSYSSEEMYNCIISMVQQDCDKENFSEDFKANVKIRLFEIKDGLIHGFDLIREASKINNENFSIKQMNEFIKTLHFFVQFYKVENSLSSMLKNLFELSQRTDDTSKTKYEFIKTFINKE